MAERDAQQIEIVRSRSPYLLDAKQLSKILNVPESWIRVKARTGGLPRLKLGHYVRFRLEDVTAYLSRATGE
jgi:excisionase family DNA binding protein